MRHDAEETVAAADGDLATQCGDGRGAAAAAAQLEQRHRSASAAAAEGGRGHRHRSRIHHRRGRQNRQSAQSSGLCQIGEKLVRRVAQSQASGRWRTVRRHRTGQTAEWGAQDRPAAVVVLLSSAQHQRRRTRQNFFQCSALKKKTPNLQPQTFKFKKKKTHVLKKKNFFFIKSLLFKSAQFEFFSVLFIFFSQWLRRLSDKVTCSPPLTLTLFFF